MAFSNFLAALLRSFSSTRISLILLSKSLSSFSADKFISSTESILFFKFLKFASSFLILILEKSESLILLFIISFVSLKSASTLSISVLMKESNCSSCASFRILSSFNSSNLSLIFSYFFNIDSNSDFFSKISFSNFLTFSLFSLILFSKSLILSSESFGFDNSIFSS